MKKIFFFTLISFLVFMTGCSKTSIEGEYKGSGGKVGIFEMSSMTIEKGANAGSYNVKFSGAEKTLTYENVEFKESELKINDKGFTMPVKIEGSKATVTQGGAVFEKNSK